MTRLIHRLHVWTGAGSGLVILLLCLSGSFAVFRLEISQWVAGGIDAPASCALDADAAFALLHAGLVREAGALEGKRGIRRLSLPALTGGHWELRLANGARAQVDACGRKLEGSRAQTADFLVNLHTRLFMGKPGRWIVGAFGVLMLVSVVTGVLAHRKLLRQLFTLRTGRSPRLARSDGHKLLGIWLLPFLLLTAFSGAWLGVATLFPLPDIKGVNAQAVDAYVLPQGLQSMLDDARRQLPELEPVFIDFFPAKGHMSVRGNIPGHLVQRYSAEVLYAAGGGVLLGVHDPRALQGLRWWHQAMMPLHLGDWAGISLRWLYAVFGMGCAGLVWLGLWLWADRRRNVAGTLLPRGALASWLLRGGASICAMVVVCPILVWRLTQDGQGPDMGGGLLQGIGAVLSGWLLYRWWRLRGAQSTGR
ncbi:MAG: PepSY-associated TM helix domain-containing protein [Moraxellaceae bacterium]|nr:PepSY-associated TM helix domain-containing protein [Moraxellaceae bacterium]